MVGRSNNTKTVLLWVFGGLLGLTIIIAAVLVFITLTKTSELSTSEEINEWLGSIGLQCESGSELNLGSLPLTIPELAEILERNHFCIFAKYNLSIEDTHVSSEYAEEYMDLNYIRLSEKDYGAAVDAIGKEYQEQQNSDRIRQILSELNYEECKDRGYYIVPSISKAVDAQSLRVAGYVFLGKNLQFSELVQSLKEREIKYSFTDSLCDDWSKPTVVEQPMQIDSSTAEPEPPLPEDNSVAQNENISQDATEDTVTQTPVLEQHQPEPEEATIDSHRPSIDIDLLPTLLLASDQYVFLDGSQTKPSEDFGFWPDCWDINYKIAFKDSWGIDAVDAIFTQEDFFNAIKSRIQQMYPAEDPTGGFHIIIEVYKYNGKDTLRVSELDDVEWSDIEWNYDLSPETTGQRVEFSSQITRGRIAIDGNYVQYSEYSCDESKVRLPDGWFINNLL